MGRVPKRSPRRVRSSAPRLTERRPSHPSPLQSPPPSAHHHPTTPSTTHHHSSHSSTTRFHCWMAWKRVWMEYSQMGDAENTWFCWLQWNIDANSASRYSEFTRLAALAVSRDFCLHSPSPLRQRIQRILLARPVLCGVLDFFSVFHRVLNPLEHLGVGKHLGKDDDSQRRKRASVKLSSHCSVQFHRIINNRRTHRDEAKHQLSWNRHRQRSVCNESCMDIQFEKQVPDYVATGWKRSSQGSCN